MTIELIDNDYHCYYTGECMAIDEQPDTITRTELIDALNEYAEPDRARKQNLVVAVLVVILLTIISFILI